MAEYPVNWRRRAACRNMGPEPFYLEHGGSSYADAKDVCAACPVRRECLDDALSFETSHNRYGYWGGTSPNQRKRASAQRRKSAA